MLRAAVRVVAVLALLVLVGVAWISIPREPATASAGAAPPADASADPAATRELRTRLEGLIAGEIDEVTFTSAELGLLLSGPLASYIPAAVGAPRVVLEGGSVRADIPIPLASALPLPDLAILANLVPDSVMAEVRGLVRSGDGWFAVHVEGMSVAGVPVPAFLARSLAHRVGFGGANQEESLSWPLPAGLSAVYIDGDRLFLRGNP